MDVFQQAESTAQFLSQLLKQAIENLEFLAMGWHCRVFAFDAAGQKLVLKVAREPIHVFKEKMAYQRFKQILPVPIVFAEGWQDGFAWCIQARCRGQVLDDLSPQLQPAWPELVRILRNLHLSSLNPERHETRWRQSLAQVHGFSQFNKTDLGNLLKAERWQKYLEELELLLPVCPKLAYLIHGDLKPANILVLDNKVTGLIDWATLGQGDFVYDWAVLLWYLPQSHYISALSDLVHAYVSVGFDLSVLSQRLRAYTIHSALGALLVLSRRQNKPEFDRLWHRFQAFLSMDLSGFNF